MGHHGNAKQWLLAAQSPLLPCRRRGVKHGKQKCIVFYSQQGTESRPEKSINCALRFGLAGFVLLFVASAGIAADIAIKQDPAAGVKYLQAVSRLPH